MTVPTEDVQEHCLCAQFGDVARVLRWSVAICVQPVKRSTVANVCVKLFHSRPFNNAFLSSTGCPDTRTIIVPDSTMIRQ